MAQEVRQNSDIWERKDRIKFIFKIFIIFQKFSRNQNAPIQTQCSDGSRAPQKLFKLGKIFKKGKVRHYKKLSSVHIIPKYYIICYFIF